VAIEYFSFKARWIPFAVLECLAYFQDYQKFILFLHIATKIHLKAPKDSFKIIKQKEFDHYYFLWFYLDSFKKYPLHFKLLVITNKKYQKVKNKSLITNNPSIICLNITLIWKQLLISCWS